MSEELNKSYGSAMDLFMSTHETIEEAKKKSSSESGSRSKHFRIAKDGTYNLRILPLAPVIDADGKALPMTRKGYEYPTKELVLKIKTGVDNKGKEKVSYVNICNAKLAYPNIPMDLVDCYVETACTKYGDDKPLCDKLRSNSFSGGLKYGSKRSMYAYDLDNPKDGLQIFQLSYAQYMEVEKRKLTVWQKCLAKNPKAQCPISSVIAAYPLEIERTTENRKTSYSFNIDTLSETSGLTEEQLQTLLDAPRLPEVLYRYSRFHLEATIAYLKQFDEDMGMDIVNTKEIQDCIDQIKTCIPSGDTSHFKASTDEGEETAASVSGIDGLWETYDAIEKEGLTDQSDEGQNLRTSIKEFIESEELNIRVTRSKTNLTLLEEIQDALGTDGGDNSPEEDDEDEEPAVPTPTPTPTPAPVEEGEDEEDDEPAVPARRVRNDDSNEPAVRPQRRSARPVRR